MQTFNKRGDQGETSLLFGQRVPKSHPQCEAYGTIDEAVSALGLARALSPKEKVREILRELQAELFIPGAEMAVPEGYYARYAQENKVVTPEAAERLERLIEELEAVTPMPQAFVLPGKTAAAAAIDLARTFVRRAERRSVALKEAGLLPNENLLPYLNRLADLLFTLARYEEAD